MAMSWVAPSASATRRRPRRARSSVRAPPSSAGEGRAPEAPEASSRTVSLVDMQPSELIRLTVRATAPPRAARAAAASTTASVVMTHSMVARPGASMPTPLIMPPALQATPSAVRETASSLGTVSVVIMARAASWPASGVGASAPAARPAPDRRAGMSRGTPMTPVEHTRTSSGRTGRCGSESVSSSATRAAVAAASSAPRAPVQALAEPELRMTARAPPSATAARDHATGAATTRLVVKTPAATSSGPSLTTRARSGLPEALRPARTPAARNPAGAVTLTGRLLR